MKRKSILLAACFSFSALISCGGQKGGGGVSMKTQTDSVAYAIGVTIGSNMKKDGLDSLNLDILMNTTSRDPSPRSASSPPGA